MSNANKSNSEANSIEEQLKKVRSDVADLADLIKGIVNSQATDAEEAISGKAEDLLKRTKEAAQDASLRAKGAAATIEEHIAEKPVQSAMIALLIGIVIGSFGRR